MSEYRSVRLEMDLTEETTYFLLTRAYHHSYHHTAYSVYFYFIDSESMFHITVHDAAFLYYLKVENRVT